MSRNKWFSLFIAAIMVSVFCLVSVSGVFAENAKIEGQLKEVDGKVVLHTDAGDYVVDGRDMSYYVGMDMVMTGDVTEQDGVKHIQVVNALAKQ